MSSAAASPRPRRERGVQESLLAVALGLEAVLLFFVALTAFGLKSVPEVWALGGGAAFIVAIVVTALFLRFRVAVWVGWVLQALLIATGVILPLMWFIGAGFTGIWIYCFVKARQIRTRQIAAGLTDPVKGPARER